MTTTTDPALDEQVDDAEVANGSSAPHDGPSNELVRRDDAGELSTMDGPDPDPDSDSESDSPGADEDADGELTLSFPEVVPVAASVAPDLPDTSTNALPRGHVALLFGVGVTWTAILFVLWVFFHLSWWIIAPAVIGTVLLAIATGRFYGPATIHRTVPELGNQARLYRLLSRLHIPYVPRLSDEEETTLREAATHTQTDGLDKAIEIAQTEHVWLRRRLPHVEVSVSGVRGRVGKGTSVTNLAVAAVEAHPQPILLSDSRDNVGNVAPRMGLLSMRNDDDPAYRYEWATPTIRQCIKRRKDGEFKTAVESFTALGTLEGWPLFVLAADVGDLTMTEALEDIVAAEARELFDNWATQFGMTLHESGNERGHDLDTEIVHRKGQKAIPYFVHQPGMEYIGRETFAGSVVYRNDPEILELIQKHGVFLATATQDKPSHTRERFAERYGFRPEQVFLIPYDEYFVHQGIMDDDEHDEVSLLDTNTPVPPDPIVDAAGQPKPAKLAYLNSLNYGMFTWLSPELQEEYVQLHYQLTHTLAA